MLYLRIHCLIQGHGDLYLIFFELKKKLFYDLPILYLQIASLLMVHKMLSVAHLSFVHTEVSCFLCLIAAAATDLFSFRIKMGAFIYNLIFNSFSGKSFLDS